MDDHILILITVIICLTALAFKFKCKHKWEIEKEVKLWNTEISDDKPSGVKYILSCEKCGTVKAKRL